MNAASQNRRFELKLVLLLLLLMILAQRAFSITQQFLPSANAGMLPERWAWLFPYRYSVHFLLLQPLCFATLFGVPIAIGLACACGRLRLRFVFPLGLLYILLPLRLYHPLLSGLYGLIHQGEFVEPFQFGFFSLREPFRKIFFSPIAAYAGALILLVLCPLIGMLARRLPSYATASPRAKRTFMLCFALAFLLLAALTVASERQVFVEIDGKITAAIDADTPAVGETDTRPSRFFAVRYLFMGGQLTQQYLLLGGRLHQLWYCCCVFALAYLYCAGKLRWKDAAAWSGIGLAFYALAALLTPIPAGVPEIYYKGFNMFFVGTGFRPPHIPAVIVNGILLFIPAALLLGLAALVRAVGGSRVSLPPNKEEK